MRYVALRTIDITISPEWTGVPEIIARICSNKYIDGNPRATHCAQTGSALNG